jgi:SSS family solute:Na+ symporter
MSINLLLVLMVGLLLYAYYHRSKNYSDYYKASGNIGQFESVSSYLSTNVGGGTIVTLVAIAYQGGFAALYLGISYALGLFLLTFLTDKIRKLSLEENLISLSEYAYYFYKSNRIEKMVSYIIIISYFLFLSVQLLAISYFVSNYTSLSLNITIIIMTLFISIYSMFGGLKTDIKTDLIQFILIVLILTIVIFLSVKQDLMIDFQQISLNNYLGIEYQGIGFIIVAFLALGPAVMVSMDIWQRILSAKNDRIAKQSLLKSSIFLILLFSFFTYIGILTFQISPNLSNPDTALIEFSKNFPEYVQGLILVLAFVSITSTADSLLVVIVTSLFNSNIQKLKKYSKNVFYIRVLILIVSLMALMLAISTSDLVTLLASALSSLAILLPALIFPLLGFINEKASFYSIMMGLLTGLIFIFINENIAFIPAVILSYITYLIIFIYTRSRNDKN